MSLLLLSRAVVALVAIGGAVGLTGCQALSSISTSATATLAQASAEANTAIAAYGIIKGIAVTADAAFPILTPGVALLTATLDPLVVKIQAEEAAANTSLAALIADTTQLTSLANQLATETASVVHVVANPAVSAGTPAQVSELWAAKERLAAVRGRLTGLGGFPLTL